jgi:peptidoglycan hydrolase-like protein with peptidoglycan-binding domain
MTTQAFPDFALIPGTDVAVWDLYGVVAERGSEGPEVVKIQELLAIQGLDVNITGVFDQKTELAVRAFQEIKGMRETGKVSNALMEILKEESILRLPSEPQPPATEIADTSRKVTGMSKFAKGFLAVIALLALSGGKGQRS